MPAAKKSRKPRTFTFAAVRATYVERKGLDPVKGAKSLRGKIRGTYGKDTPEGRVVTKWVDRHNKSNRDGNRYGDATPAEAKVILSL